jgi:hypothetical protein
MHHGHASHTDMHMHTSVCDSQQMVNWCRTWIVLRSWHFQSTQATAQWLYALIWDHIYAKLHLAVQQGYRRQHLTNLAHNFKFTASLPQKKLPSDICKTQVCNTPCLEYQLVSEGRRGHDHAITFSVLWNPSVHTSTASETGSQRFYSARIRTISLS